MSENKFFYKPFDVFILRTPLKSFNYFQDLIANNGFDVSKLVIELRNPIIKEAIFLASPDLYFKMENWLCGKKLSKKEVERLIYSVIKYLSRLSTRCTPFGLFAGYCLGKIGDKNETELAENRSYYGHLRLDMNYLCALAIDLSKIPEIKKQIKFYPNSSILESGDKLRYVEYRYINSQRKHFMVGVDNSKYLKKILKVAENGANINDLANLLVDDEITNEDAKKFIDELIESQLLISELEPSVTGPEFLDQIIETLKPLKDIDYIIKLLKEIENEILKIRNQSIGISTENYLKINKKLLKLDTKYDLKYLFQTDMVIYGHKMELNCKITDDIKKGIEIMNRLTPKIENENLSRFKEAFYDRYEEREVPLLQALDVESGIGYIQNTGSRDINPLIDDIILPIGNRQNEMNIRWNPIQSFLLKKYNEFLLKGLNEVEISDDDVKDFQVNWDDLPPTFNAMVEFVESSESEKDLVICFSKAGGASAANLLGRFCHSNKDLNDYVKTIIEKEKDIYPDAILAEIVHLPESRTGNILLRPAFREYEIPYLAKASVSKEKQISVDDILVSIKHGRRIVLRSKSLNKEIIPRLSNAHNFSFNSLPIYQFLCDLQTQDLRGGVGFSWGALANEYKFLPRVRYRNIILSESTWNINKDDIKLMLDAKIDSELEQKVKLWKDELKLPDYVLLADGDNELLLHLNNLLCIKTLLSLVKKRSGFRLKEFLYDPQRAMVKRGKDVFTNQVIFSFFKSQINS